MSDNKEFSSITVKPYSDKSIIVQGDFETYAREMKKFQARWNPRLKAGPGWIVPLEYESAVRIHFGIEESEDAYYSQRFKSAPKKVNKAKPSLLPESVIEEENNEEEILRELAPISVKAPPASVKALPASVKVPPTSVKALSRNDVVNNDDDEEEEDIVSLARKMKDMMARIERLEFHH